MSEIALTYPYSRKTYRIAVGVLFFLQGLCFATWASRIPSIQSSLRLSDAGLGMVLLALPVGSLLALPLSGWLVARFGSRMVATISLVFYSLLLALLGTAHSIEQLVLVLVGFGIAGNNANIAINTQAVGVEAYYGRNIMASFHGLWSLAGFSAAGIGTLMIGNAVSTSQHFLLIMAVIIAGVGLSFPFLLPAMQQKGNTQKVFVRPDRTLLLLGLIAFCSLICEGAMFDWSGIYFQDVVQAKGAWVGAGYTAFMLTMASGRFVADRFTFRFGFNRTIQLSGILIAAGLLLSVLAPFLITSLVGFLLVGFGVSAVVPLVYSEAGKSKTLSPGAALAAVTSIGFLGFLIGPPVIGLIAGVSSLRISFLLIAAMGLCVTFLVAKTNRRQA